MKPICLEALVNHEGKSVISCAVCSSDLKRPSKAGEITILLKRMFEHACLHLNEPFYQCQHCDYQCSSEGAITRHLRNRHSVTSIVSNYTIISMDHYQRISEMIKECFAQHPDLLKGSKRLPKRIFFL